MAHAIQGTKWGETVERGGHAAFSGHYGWRDVPRTGGSLRHLVLRQPTDKGVAQIF